MRLHVGCGKRVLDGWTNIDVVRNPGAPRDPEILAPAHAIPLPDGCASEVMAIHVFEHVALWQAPAVLAEWRRLLRPGGRLVLELPDLLKCARNLLRLAETGGKPLQQMAMWGIYGDATLEDPHMMHQWGWWPESLSAFLVQQGFRDPRSEVPEWHRAGRDDRDMRIVAVRA